MYLTKSTAHGPSAISIEERPYGKVCLFSGWLTKTTVDSDGDVIEAGAFSADEPLSAKGVPLLWQHDRTCPVGKWIDLKESTEGVYGTAEVLCSIAKGAEAAALLQQGAIDGLSVGFRANRKKVSTKEVTDSSGTKRKVRSIAAAKLMECSLVTFPAHHDARIKLKSAGAAFADLQHFEEVLIEHGLTEREAKALLLKGFKHMTEIDGINPDDADEVARKAAAEAKARHDAEEAAKAASLSIEQIKKVISEAFASTKGAAA